MFFTSVFQYVSWFNSVSVKDATDVADRAARVYENTAAAIGTRRYATFVFVPSLQGLIMAKARANVLSAQAYDNQAKTKDIVYTPANGKKRTPDVEPFLMQTTGTLKLKEEIALHKSDMDVKHKRFASYYEQLKLWNEYYDHQLSEIEYALDRPVFDHADLKVTFRVSEHNYGNINCFNYLTEELEKNNISPHSLKFRFAGINKCFKLAHGLLDRQLDEAITKDKPEFSGEAKTEITNRLNSLLTMENEFRCYAHRRIDYYNSQKELAILSTTYISRWLNDGTRTGALKHFEETASRCAVRSGDALG